MTMDLDATRPPSFHGLTDQPVYPAGVAYRMRTPIASRRDDDAVPQPQCGPLLHRDAQLHRHDSRVGAGLRVRRDVQAFCPRPVDALGLRDVLLNLQPNDAGFAWRAEGGSALGPFTGTGAILLPRGQRSIVQVAALNVSGTRASGSLRSDPGGFTGRLDVAGGGLDGQLLFNPVGRNQRIAVNLVAGDARFVGPPPILVAPIQGGTDGALRTEVIGPGPSSGIISNLFRHGNVVERRREGPSPSVSPPCHRFGRRDRGSVSGPAFIVAVRHSGHTNWEHAQ